MKLNKIVIAVALVGAFTLFGGTSQAFAQGVATINTSGVNIRQEPSQSASILRTAESGTNVTINSVEGEFLNITIDGAEAYIASQFVEVQSAPGLVADDGVNIRSFPSTEYDIIGKVSMGDLVEVVGQLDDWYVVKYDGRDGFINKNFLLGDLIQYTKKLEKVAEPEALYATITSDNGVNLRIRPSQESEIISSVASGEVVDILEAEDNWYKVSYYGTVGYVSSEFAEAKLGKKPTSASVRAQRIIDYAKQFLGTPYVWSGTNLNSGVDCSGFTYAVMKNFGISLSRTSREQIYDGQQVSRSELKAGDLIFFNTGGNSPISHVAIYIGNSQFIHSASTNRKGVIISSLNEDYYNRTYCGASRVL